MKKSTFFLLLTLLSANLLASQNLLINGNFETAGSGTGFTTNYNLPSVTGSSMPK
ncbi:MAG: hypothetical protein H7239_14530, partial [Flavobacterium sp.]|nr:hypothetical protein [Flavobacterium sp.]